MRIWLLIFGAILILGGIAVLFIPIIGALCCGTCSMIAIVLGIVLILLGLI